VEGKAETSSQKRIRRLRGRSLKSRKMTKEEHEVPESSTRGNLGPRAQVTPGPCGVNRGGSSPMCGTPCCSHLNSAHVPFSISNGVCLRISLQTRTCHIPGLYPLFELILIEKFELSCALSESQTLLVGILGNLCCIVVTNVRV